MLLKNFFYNQREAHNYSIKKIFSMKSNCNLNYTSLLLAAIFQSYIMLRINYIPLLFVHVDLCL